MRLCEANSVLREITPVLLASTIQVCFGTMFGWASVSYPLLLDPINTPIPLTIDQTSLIAGFLFEGNALGGFFAGSTIIPSKIAICLCLSTQVAGWILMYFSEDMFWFLGSRFSIGVVHGYGQGQIKRFIKETCRPHVGKNLNLYLPVCLSIGVFIAFVVGAYVDFKIFSICMGSIPFIALVAFLIMPNNKVETKESITNKQFNVFEVIKDRNSWKGLLLLLIFVFVHQCGGAPPNIVYTQMIFSQTGNRYPKISAIIYAGAFVINTLISIKFAKKFSPKTNLIVGLTFSILAFSLLSLYYYFKEELLNSSEFFVLLPLAFLLIYNFFHTFGCNSVNLYILRKIIPPRSVDIAFRFFIVHFSISAVISNKVFQTIFSGNGWYLAYIFFVAVLVFGLICSLFIKDFQVKDKSLTVNVGINLNQTDMRGMDNLSFNES